MGRSFPSLKRQQATVKPIKKFIVFCEGLNTEPEYLKMLLKLRKDAQVAMDPIKGAGVPLTIANKAAIYALRIKRSKNSFEKDDEVWAMFDRDDHDYWQQALSICHNAGVKVAYSNPCFELWLILHYMDYDAPDDRYQLQKLASNVVSGYDAKRRKIPNCAHLSSLLELAELRAEKQSKRRADEKFGNGPPQTTVWKLTRAVRTWSALVKKEM